MSDNARTGVASRYTGTAEASNGQATKILLSGVPGTGKTTVARYIERHHGFRHIDMEQDGFAARHALAKDPHAFLRALPSDESALLSWGFGPFTDRGSIDYLRDRGFALVWLDGNRVASFRAFMRREQADPVMEALYYGQMQMIVVTRVVESLAPRVVNPFEETGKFRPVEHIAADILAAAATARRACQP